MFRGTSPHVYVHAEKTELSRVINAIKARVIISKNIFR